MKYFIEILQKMIYIDILCSVGKVLLFVLVFSLDKRIYKGKRFSKDGSHVDLYIYLICSA